jgi:hypothetical protein
VRYLYELQPPVPGFVFSATYYFFLESLSLLTQSSLRKDDIDNETILVEEGSNDEVRLPMIGGLELGIYLFSLPIACKFLDSRRSLPIE